jgi:DNA-binding MarR family transcriptional regulator
MPVGQRPIGYWLKQIDTLIETHFQRALAEDGLDRRQWQVANTLAAGPATRAQLDEAIAPFLADDPDGGSRALGALLGRGWVEETAGQLALTDAGAAAHTRIQDRVNASRRRITDGISDEQYQAVVATLERMAANLGADAGGGRI